MTDYVLVGGGAFARELLDWFSPVFGAEERFAGYLMDEGYDAGKLADRLPRLGDVAGYRPQEGQALVLAVGAPKDKRTLVEALADRAPRFATLLHPRAWVSASARIGQGVTVCPFGSVSADAMLEDFVTLNAFAGAGHDVTVGRFSTLSAYVDLTGGVRLAEGCFVGSGARVLPGVSIGEDCTVGAGAVVVRSAKPGKTLYAAPARTL